MTRSGTLINLFSQQLESKVAKSFFGLSPRHNDGLHLRLISKRSKRTLNTWSEKMNLIYIPLKKYTNEF